ncbi:hypothetical protein CERZMDRAFT_89300 [Cercospora zeae-maydis SCOH1-5]|uniref:Uncharacterized protein n=1 Tax=Cercospora zeae-maydis SCOH1-5 TaxID=717836 RepID=A0A6A6EYC7_9PEZI|nr:hypothetical protein CERZMDRAFT_89300 [Cercospora zeae-maydis SCOH1-5]
MDDTDKRGKGEAEAINEVVTAQESEGEPLTASIETTKDLEARKEQERKHQYLDAEYRRYDAEVDYFWREFRRQEIELWAVPGSNKEIWSAFAQNYSAANAQRKQAHQDAICRLLEGVFPDDEATDEVKEDDEPQHKPSRIEEDRAYRPQTSIADEAQELEVSVLDAMEDVKEDEGRELMTSLKDEDDAQEVETSLVSTDDIKELETLPVNKDDAQEPETSLVSKDDAQEPETSLASKDDAQEPKPSLVNKDDVQQPMASVTEELLQLQPSVPDERHNSLVDTASIEHSDTSLHPADEKPEDFPSLPTTATAKNDSIPHPKSLYKKPSPIVLSAPPLTTSTVQTGTKQPEPRGFRSSRFTSAHAGNDNSSGSQTLVLGNCSAARPPRSAEKPAEKQAVRESTVQDDRVEKAEEPKPLEKGKQVLLLPSAVSAPKKQNKPKTETPAASAPPGVVSEPIFARKRKEKKVKGPKAPFSGRPAKPQPPMANKKTSPGSVVQPEKAPSVIRASDILRPSETSGMDMGRVPSGEKGGEMSVAFGALVLLLVLVLLGCYSVGR